MSKSVYCRSCGELIDPEIIDDVHVDGFDDDDIVCQKCAKAWLAFLSSHNDSELKIEF